MDLIGRHVVVTGAADGIDKALAQRFHAAGARVVAADLNGVERWLGGMRKLQARISG